MCDVSGRMSEWEWWNINICMYIAYVYRICMFTYFSLVFVLNGYKWCIIVMLFITHMMLIVVGYIGCVAGWFDMMAGYYACTHVPQDVSMPICIVVLTLCVYAWCILGCIHMSEYLCMCNVGWRVCMYVCCYVYVYVMIVYIVYFQRIAFMKLYGVVYIHRCICPCRYVWCQ